MTSRPRDYVVSIVVSDIMGAFLTAFYLLIVVLLMSRPTRSFMATARLARMEAREQVNAGGGHVIGHQSADAETRARLEEEQTRREKRKLTDALKKRSLSSTGGPAAGMHGRIPATNSAATRILPCTPRKATASTRVGSPSPWETLCHLPRATAREAGAKRRKEQ